MRSTACTDVVTTITTLTSTNLDHATDDQIHDDLQALLPTLNQLTAHIATLTAAFHRRDLAHHDAHRTTRDWLCAHARITPHTATTWLHRGELLHDLPPLATAMNAGTLTPDHLRPITDLARHLGTPHLAPFAELLADLATTTAPTQLAHACHRIREHLDPDGPHPDPDAGQRRCLTLSRSGSLFSLHGRLDLDAGAAVLTALDAITTPPTPGDDRSAAQRRADALTDLCTQALTHQHLPTTGGQRPHLGLLITPHTLLTGQAAPTTAPTGQNTARAGQARPPAGATQQRPTADTATATAEALRAWAAGHTTTAHPRPEQPGPHQPPGEQAGGKQPRGEQSGPEQPHGERPGRAQPGADTTSAETTNGAETTHADTAGPTTTGPATPVDDDDQCHTAAGGDPLTRAGIPPGPEPPWLNWAGHIPLPIAQRLACDCHVWRAVLDPTTGLPLEVGRTHRLVPHWIRKALHARDRGCRWPGCLAHANWTDAHHLIEWYYGGETNINNLLLLCRYHHTRVHEGQWTIRLDPTTGEVWITRPDGTPYELGPSQPWRPPAAQPTKGTHRDTGIGRAA